MFEYPFGSDCTSPAGDVVLLRGLHRRRPDAFLAAETPNQLANPREW